MRLSIIFCVALTCIALATDAQAHDRPGRVITVQPFGNGMIVVPPGSRIIIMPPQSRFGYDWPSIGYPNAYWSPNWRSPGSESDAPRRFGVPTGQYPWGRRMNDWR